MKILVINGPNLNLLGTREPEIYGRFSLKDISQMVEKEFKEQKLDVEWRQSNSESQIVDWVQLAGDDGFKAIIINPGALTHTSVSLSDALRLFSGKKVEVHLSNTYKREIYRKTKYTSSSCDGVIEGLGPIGYLLAIRSVLGMEV